MAVFDSEARHCAPALPFPGTVSKGSKATRASWTNKYGGFRVMLVLGR